MSDPIVFESTSPRFSLPMLFAGQSQKEAYVNEAFYLADILLHSAIESVASSPPAAPLNGQAWIVGSSPSGDWAGQSGKLACRLAGNWLFVVPRNGMRVLDQSTGQVRSYNGAWIAPAAPVAPTGGATVDAEARSTIADLIARLRECGVFPAT